MTDTSGPVVVSDDNANYTLAAGDTITGDGKAAALTTTGMRDTVDIYGSIDGGAADGLMISGIGAPPAPRTSVPTVEVGSATIDIHKGATVSGATGLVIQAPGETFDFDEPYRGDVDATLVNEGTIRGTGTVALIDQFIDAHLLSVDNRAGGFIGGIAGNVGVLTNAGTIDGGTFSALSIGTNQTIENSGTITSAATGATIAPYSSTTIHNSGTIANTGGGAAINVDGALTLTNTGHIAGDVIVDQTQYFPNILIDQSGGGTIDGDVTIQGGYYDTVIARGFAADGTIDTGITGTLTGGNEFDILQVKLSDAIQLSSIKLPTNFDFLALDMGHDADATLKAGETQTSQVLVGGRGAFTNDGAFTTRGAAIGDLGHDGSQLVDLTNNGTIDANLAASFTGQTAAVDFHRDVHGSDGHIHVQSFTNTGTINGENGSAVSLGRVAGRYFSFVNSGTLFSHDAFDGTANVSLTGNKTDSFLNSGLIEGIDGAALRLDAAPGYDHGSAVNTGTIISDFKDAATLTGVDFDNQGLIRTGSNDPFNHQYAVRLTGGALHNEGKITNDLAAVHANGASISNGGLIQSYNGAAIEFDQFSSDGPITIDNGVEGRIKGVTAIQFTEDGPILVSNEGRIFGDLNIGSSMAAGSTIMNSGYIRGNVTFAGENDRYDGHGGSIVGTVSGGSGNDTLVGGSGHDVLDGGSDDDRITGGGGTDLLTGGYGSDSFVFTGHDGGLKAYSADEITDFDVGFDDDHDRIDVSAIDPTATASAFSFIGTAAFDGGAGELRYYTHGGQTFVEADYDGDGHRDLLIKLDGVHALTAADFVL